MAQPSKTRRVAKRKTAAPARRTSAPRPLVRRRTRRRRSLTTAAAFEALLGGIFRRLARHAMTVTDPVQFMKWAEVAVVSYALLNNRMSLAEAINLMDGDPRRAAVTAFERLNDTAGQPMN